MRLIWNVIQLRLKLIYRNKATLLLSVFTMLIFIVLIGSLYKHEKESVQIPIAYVDEDGTEFSKEFIRNIHNNELLRAKEIELAQGIKQIKNGKLQVLFVIRRGAMEKIEAGDLEGLMDIYYIAENYVPPLIGDVVVGEMLEEVCIITAVNYLREAIGSSGSELDLQIAYNYGQKLADSSKQNYYMQIHYIQLGSNIELNQEKINQTIIFKQMILGIMLSFIAFYSMFSAIHIVKDEELKLSEKIAMTKTNKWLLSVGNYLSILIGTSFIAVLSALVNAIYSEQVLVTFLSNSLIFFLYNIVISAIIMLLAYIFRQVSSFVVVGSALILTMGIISGCFFSIDFAIDSIKQFASLTPSYYALMELLSVVVKGELTGGYALVSYSISAVILLGSIHIVILKLKKY